MNFQEFTVVNDGMGEGRFGNSRFSLCKDVDTLQVHQFKQSTKKSNADQICLQKREVYVQSQKIIRRKRLSVRHKVGKHRKN